MGSIDLVIMASPRSGTKYMATVLNACGLRVFHERYFTPLNPEMAGNAIRYDGKFGEVSAAAFGFRRVIPKRALILHQTRHPVPSINSLFYTSHARWNKLGESYPCGPNARKWNRHYWNSIDGALIPWAEDQYDKCAQFYFAYNSRIAEFVAKQRCGMLYQVENVNTDLVSHIFDSIGLKPDRSRIEEAIVNTSKTINRLSIEPAQAFEWFRLTNEQRAQTEQYGYSLSGVK